MISYQLCPFLASENDLGGVVGGAVRRADGGAGKGDLHLFGVGVIKRRGGDASDVLHRKEKPTLNLKSNSNMSL